MSPVCLSKHWLKFERSGWIAGKQSHPLPYSQMLLHREPGFKQCFKRERRILSAVLSGVLLKAGAQARTAPGSVIIYATARETQKEG